MNAAVRLKRSIISVLIAWGYVVYIVDGASFSYALYSTPLYLQKKLSCRNLRLYAEWDLLLRFTWAVFIKLHTTGNVQVSNAMGEKKTGNILGDGRIASESITGTHPHSSNPMKHEL